MLNIVTTTQNQGWQCPSCKRCYSPTMTTCPNCPATYTTAPSTITPWYPQPQSPTWVPSNTWSR